MAIPIFIFVLTFTHTGLLITYTLLILCLHISIFYQQIIYIASVSFYGTVLKRV